MWKNQKGLTDLIMMAVIIIAGLVLAVGYRLYAGQKDDQGKIIDNGYINMPESETNQDPYAIPDYQKNTANPTYTLPAGWTEKDCSELYGDKTILLLPDAQATTKCSDRSDVVVITTINVTKEKCLTQEEIARQQVSDSSVDYTCQERIIGEVNAIKESWGYQKLPNKTIAYTYLDGKMTSLTYYSGDGRLTYAGIAGDIANSIRFRNYE
jgi:hypothetical protein